MPLVGLLLPVAAPAAEIAGASLGPAWGLPFVGMLLSIALLPLGAPGFWHRHQGKVAAAWGLAFLLPFAVLRGPAPASEALVHALLAEYLPFVILLTALYTVAGGIFIRGNLHGSARLNTGLLAIGALLASFMGTTGASMLMIRPLIRANDNRRHRAHVVIFFIFIVSNAAGSLTPLGDPPLFLGFLQGVDFFWTVRHLAAPTLFVVGVLLALFFLLDRWYFRHERALPTDPTPDTGRVGIDGAGNFALLAAVVALVLMSGLWRSDVVVDVAGTEVGLPGLVRDVGLIAVTLLSLTLTPQRVHGANHFEWAPMAEVAKLFAGIFVTIVPVIAMLRAGAHGPFASVIAAVTRPDGQPDAALYFWTTGLLSAFLDNAPTYLVFFHVAGGDAQELMTTFAITLAAISAGAVFMGAGTYIGNAPNMMVKAVAERRGIVMPGFFGYMLWSGCVLLPLLLIVTWIWFL
ncbi:MAG: putative anion permease [Burkholderiaceae bacterium]|nr:MAG: putative anion permease [Burkholderiaceae bacterium]